YLLIRPRLSLDEAPAVLAGTERSKQGHVAVAVNRLYAFVTRFWITSRSPRRLPGVGAFDSSSAPRGRLLDRRPSDSSRPIASPACRSRRLRPAGCSYRASFSACVRERIARRLAVTSQSS